MTSDPTPNTTLTFKGKNFRFDFPRPTIIMGILNLTPDSFFDGGRYHADNALQRALAIQAQGAEIIDIGGESTRPSFNAVSTEDEWRRIEPILKVVKAALSIPISIDTRHPQVAEKALQTGADIINDTGLRENFTEMLPVVARYDAGYILMHNAPLGSDPFGEVETFFTNSLALCRRAGIPETNIALDPGIGFGKDIKLNLALIRNLSRYTKGGRPLLLGASRKSFLKFFPGATSPEGRIGGSLATACYAATQGVQILRVHDVAETVQAVRVMEALTNKNDDVS